MKPNNLRRVIVANDSLDGMDLALAKAAMIEHYSGADVLVVEALYDSIAEEPTEVLPKQEQALLIEALKAAERNAMRKLVQPFQTRVASIDTQVLWDKNAMNAIVEAASGWGAQLLIKPVSEHHPVADFLHTPLDWALMRHAPCAMLVSKRASWAKPCNVLAAVDLADDKHDALCREILRTASTLAGILGTDLHVTSAYPELGQRVDELQIAPDFAGIKADMRERRSQAVAGMIEELDLDVKEVHLLEGKPAQVIPALAHRLEATLIVLGMAARRGLGKLVIGNTAEDIISRIESDLVTVREPWS